MSKSRNIKLIGFASLGVIMLLGGVAIAVPAVTQSTRWIQEADTVEEANAQLAKQIADLETAKENHPDVVALNEDLNIKFPTTVKGTLLLKDISNAAAQAGMSASAVETVNIATPSILEVAPVEEAPAEEAPAEEAPADEAPSNEGEAAAPAPAPKLATMNIEITVSGTDSQISAFLKALGQIDRAIKIDSVKISQKDDTSGIVINSMTISGTTLLYQEIPDPDKQVKKTKDNSKANSDVNNNN